MNTDISLENSVIEQYETDNEQGFDKVSEMLRAGIKAAQAGNRSEARHLLLSVTEADSANENAWLWLASISEYPEELLVFLRNVLSINPSNERALEWSKATKSLLAKTFVQRGIDAHKQNQTDFAKQCFLQAIVNDDKNEMAWLWLASTTEAVEEKMSHLQKVLRMNPENETAKASLQAAKSQKANNLMRKANAAAVSGRHEEANEILGEILQNSPDLEDAWILKSYLTNSFDEKLECFERVLEINPANETAQTSINAIRAMKAAVETKEAEQNQELAEEENQPEAASEYEFSEENDESETSETESAEIEQPEEFFASEENQVTKEIPQPVFAFEEIEEAQAEEQYFPELTEISQPEEVAYAEHYDQNEPLEFAPETPVSDYAENYEEAFASEESDYEEEIFTSQESDNEDFYSQGNFEQETVEVSESSEENVEFAEETISEPVAEMQFDPDEVVEPFEETAAAESDFEEEITAPVQEYKEEYEPEEIEETVAMQPEIFEESEVFEEEIVEEKSFEAKNAEFEDVIVDESIAENIKAETNGNGNGAVHLAENEKTACPFCRAENEPQAFVCNGCQAILTLSDLEMILAHKEADAEMLRRAVEQMEVEQSRRDFDANELILLGIGYINLKNLRDGMTCLQKALKLEPNNILLDSQVHSLAIRLAEIEQQESIHRSMPQDRTIMVVDDSATVRKLISGKLEKSGHTVISAVDGVDALEKLKEVMPDLVLLDITMPRMDGYQVCKMIRNNPVMKDIPVVMISGKDGFFDKVRGRMAGTTGYITKPFGPETLMKTVEEFVAPKSEAVKETAEVR